MRKQFKRFVYPLLTFIFLLGFSGPASAGNVTLNSLKAGDTVNFGGYTWIVLNPATGYLLMKDDSGNHGSFTAPFDSEADPNWKKSDFHCSFDPSNQYNIAYYLNNTFYSSMPPEEQALIQTHSWGVGNDDDESSTTVNCKIGLISYNEWNNYKNIPGRLDRLYWTCTSFTPNSIRCTGYAIAAGATLDDLIVRPALYLDPGIFVSGDSTHTVLGGKYHNTVSALINSSAGGTVTGSGGYAVGDQVQLKATPNAGYNFAGWTDANGNPVSTDAAYSFTMSNADKILVANFQHTPIIPTITIVKGMPCSVTIHNTYGTLTGTNAKYGITGTASGNDTVISYTPPNANAPGDKSGVDMSGRTDINNSKQTTTGSGSDTQSSTVPGAASPSNPTQTLSSPMQQQQMQQQFGDNTGSGSGAPTSQIPSESGGTSTVPGADSPSNPAPTTTGSGTGQSVAGNTNPNNPTQTTPTKHIVCLRFMHGDILYHSRYAYYYKGSQVTVTATSTAGDYYFSVWKDSDGNVVSYDATYTFTMGEHDITLVACFTPKNDSKDTGSSHELSGSGNGAVKNMESGDGTGQQEQRTYNGSYVLSQSNIGGDNNPSGSEIGKGSINPTQTTIGSGTVQGGAGNTLSHTVTVIATTGGEVTSGGTYGEGAQVTVTATPDNDHYFGYWTIKYGHYSSIWQHYDATYHLIMGNYDITLVAHFTPKSDSKATGSGTVQSGAWNTNTYNPTPTKTGSGSDTESSEPITITLGNGTIRIQFVNPPTTTLVNTSFYGTD